MHLVRDHVDIAALVFILIMVSLDLTFRWLAFGISESVAIDFAVFGFGYSASELVRQINAQSSGAVGARPFDRQWVWRAGAGLVCFIGLGAYHKFLSDELERKVDDLVLELRDSLKDDDPRLLDKLRKVVARASLVSLGSTGLAGSIRVGKKGRRSEVLGLLGTIAPDAKLKHQDLLLEPRQRYVALAVFGLVGLLSVLLITIR